MFYFGELFGLFGQFLERKLSFWLLFYCGAVAFSVSFFPFGLLDGRLQVIVLIPDHGFSVYLPIHDCAPRALVLGI